MAEESKPEEPKASADCAPRPDQQTDLAELLLTAAGLLHSEAAIARRHGRDVMAGVMQRVGDACHAAASRER